MKYYLSNVLKGFKSEYAHIDLKTNMRQTPNFVIVDIDQDDMPEILFTYSYMGEKYIGVLKRKNMQWYFVQTMPEKEQKSIGLGNLVNTVEGMVLTPNDIGKVINMEMLFGDKAQPFVSFINDVVTHGSVSQNQKNEQPNQQMNMQFNQSMNMQSNPKMNAQSNQLTNVNDAYLQNLTEEQIIQILGEKLPSPQAINTPSAQQALQQNLVTPIMGVNEGQQMPNMPPIGQNGSLDKEVINFTQADVTGDGNPDSIYLVGEHREGDPTQYIRNMGLRVRTGGRTLKVDFPYGNGYSPILFVGDLTGNGIPDVLVNMFSGSTGGFVTSYIYTFENEVPQMLFDSKTFNDIYTGKVTFEDQYIVRVRTNRPPWQYTINLRDRDASYLASLYDENGRLRRPTEGTLLGLTALNPIDYDVNGEFNIASVQRVIGIGNLDTLGLVETYLTWRNATMRFEPFMQYLSILGAPI